MQSKCLADEFYVVHKYKSYYGYTKNEYFFSIAGLMFLSELIFAGVEAAGIDPSKVSIRIEKKTYNGNGAAKSKPSIGVSFPSPKTTLLRAIKVVEGDIVMTNNKAPWKKRGNYGYGSRGKPTTKKFPLADPNLSQNIAAFIKESLPKKSIYAVEEVLTTEPAPDA